MRVLPCSLALGFFSTHVSAWRREGCNPFDEFHRSLSGSFEACGSRQTGLAAKEHVRLSGTMVMPIIGVILLIVLTCP